MLNILLDVTRLNTRKRASTPSGIDRVDLRYTQHFDVEQTVYVMNWMGCLFLVNKPQLKRLREGLKAKWMHGQIGDSLPGLLTLLQTNWLEFVLVTLRNIFPTQFGLRQSYSRAFIQFLDALSSPCLYVNTSHVQIRSIAALKALAAHRHIKSLYFIHDLIPITHREYVRPGGAEQHSLRLQLLSDSNAFVICNSAYTQGQLQHWLEANHGAISGSCVIPIGVEPRFLSNDGALPCPIASQYFLMLGTIEPRKNHLLALNIWRRMVEQGKEGIPKLVIIGKRGWENENIIDMLERCDAIQPYLIEKQRVSDEELAAWLRHCEAMIYPSFVEGWGMPVAEALAMGVPVICSDIPPFREVGQGQAILVDPLCASELEAAIEKVLCATDEPSPNAYCPATWKAHFTMLDEVLDGLEMLK